MAIQSLMDEFKSAVMDKHGFEKRNMIYYGLFVEDWPPRVNTIDSISVIKTFTSEKLSKLNSVEDIKAEANQTFESEN